MNINVSISGGRTSAYMGWWLKFVSGHNCNFIFMNTGLEREETLWFLNEIDQRWGLNLVWLECVINPIHGKGTTHRVTSYRKASRRGEPFEAMCAKYGLPNPDWLHCTRETKLQPFKSYTKAMGIDHYPTAIGVRSDEVDRVSENYKENNLIYPLITMNPTKESDIMHWWQAQDFDLPINQFEGNCKLCFKKGLNKLNTIAKEDPEALAFITHLEDKYSDAGSGDPRNMFRGERTSKDIINLNLKPYKVGNETQKDMLWDATGGCSESCEVFS
jgi:hypothetical protein